MNTPEIIQFLRRVESEADEQPMTEAAARLRLRLQRARTAYEIEVGQPAERRCRLCCAPVSQCRC